LHDRIKVNGKAGVLGDQVSISRDKTRVYITAQAPFSKRYLKYLSKKYLKKQNLRDWLRVVSTQKNIYELRCVHFPPSFVLLPLNIHRSCYLHPPVLYVCPFSYTLFSDTSTFTTKKKEKKRQSKLVGHEKNKPSTIKKKKESFIH
jgi:hypothetical protein